MQKPSQLQVHAIKEFILNLNIKLSIKKSNKIALKYVWEMHAERAKARWNDIAAKTNRKNVNDDILLSSSMRRLRSSVEISFFIDFSFSLHKFSSHTQFIFFL
jgi:hypothetical protein